MKDLNDIINSIAAEIKPEITKIESNKYPTTKGNYGAYMRLLGIFETKKERQVYALAIIRAGGNHFGVNAALKMF
jgi:hypothetical protein